MDLGAFLILLCLVVLLACAVKKSGMVEKMTGFGTLSGLAFNNNSLHCFKNIYDPPGASGYCSVIGKVTI